MVYKEAKVVAQSTKVDKFIAVTSSCKLSFMAKKGFLLFTYPAKK